MSSDLSVNRYNSKKYLWGFLHVKYATQFICGLALLGHILLAIYYFASKYGKYGSLLFYVQVFQIVFAFWAYGKVFLGIYKIKAKYFHDCLIWEALKVILSTFFAFRYLIRAHFTYINDEEHILSPLLYASLYDHIALWYLVAALSSVCIFCITFKCYKYVSEKAAFNEIAPPKTADTTFPEKSKIQQV